MIITTGGCYWHLRGRPKNAAKHPTIYQTLHPTTVMVVFQSLSHVQLFVTPWTAACQAALSFTASQSLLGFMSIESVMLSNHLTLLQPLSFAFNK